MKKITMVLKKVFEDELGLWGVFATRAKAVTSIENSIERIKVKLLDADDCLELAANFVAGDQEWQVIVESTIEDPDADDVWGYLITDTVQ